MKITRFSFSYFTIFIILFSIDMVTAHGGDTTNTRLDPWLLSIIGFGMTLLFLLTGMMSFYYFKLNNEDKFHISKINGLGTGFLLFLFFDFISLSSFLGIRSDNLITQLMLVGSFIVTVVFLQIISTNPRSNSTEIYILLAGIGIHSFAEGIIMGFNITLGLSALIEPFAIMSFLIHKIAEGSLFAMMLYFQFRENEKITETNSFENEEQTDKIEEDGYPSTNRILLFAIIGSVPTLVGILIAIYSDELNIIGFVADIQPIVYSISVGVIVFILPIFQFDKGKGSPSIYRYWIVIGIIIFYFGSYLHEI